MWCGNCQHMSAEHGPDGCRATVGGTGITSIEEPKLRPAREHLLEAQRLLSEASFQRSRTNLIPVVRANGDMQGTDESAVFEYVHSQLVERAKAHALLAQAITAASQLV